MTATVPISRRAVMDEKKFGTTLKKLMDERDVSQAEVAEACGISQKAVSLLLNGKNGPSWRTVIALCLYFKVSCEHFRSAEDQPAPPPPRRRKRDG